MCPFFGTSKEGRRTVSVSKLISLEEMGRGRGVQIKEGYVPKYATYAINEEITYNIS
jgi:hypothetical protein